MDHVNYFKELFESIRNYREIVLIIFLSQNDDDLLRENGFLKSDINRLKKEFETILMEQNEEYLDYIKNQEEGIIEKFLNEQNGNDNNHLSLELTNLKK